MSGNRYGQRLTPREREIIGCLAMGETVTEMAKRLWVSRKTVETHIHNAKIKLGARTMPAATFAYAERYRSAP